MGALPARVLGSSGEEKHLLGSHRPRFRSRPAVAGILSLGLIVLSGSTALAGTAASPSTNPAPDDCLTKAALATDAEAAFSCLHPDGSEKSTGAGSAAVADSPSVLPTNAADGCGVPGVDDQCEAWTAAYHDPAAGTDSSQFPSDIALSPDDKVAYIAVKDTHGSGFDSRSQIVVVAYDAASGEQLWETKWGDFDRYSFATSIAASPDGRFVYVTGCTRAEFIDPDGHLTTLAFDTENGELVWAANYDGPGGFDNGREVTLNHASDTVLISGVSAGRDNGDLDYVFLAYDAVTGAERWITRWAGIDQGGLDSPFAMTLSPDDHFMYATGWSAGEGDYNVDYGTLALATDGPDAGSILWTARYDGPGSHAPDEAFAITVSPLGDKVFVTGLSDDVHEGPPFDVNYSYATIAYDTSDGRQLWEARKMFEGTKFNAPNAIATDPTGQRVYVTGQTSSPSNTRDLDIGTVAYSTESGSEEWSDRYSTPDHDLELANSIAVAPARDAFYVSGISSDSRTSTLFNGQTQSGDQITVGYVGSTGARDWSARFNSSGYDFDVAQAVAASRDSSMLFTATTLKHNVDLDKNFYDAGTLAYELGSPLAAPEAPSTTIAFTPSSDFEGDYSDVARVSARLTNSAERAARYEAVTFELSGPGSSKTIAAVTDEDGVASAPVELTGAPGTYSLTARYAGRDGVYQASDAAAEFKVMRDKPQLKLKLGWADGHKVLRARLTDADSGAGLRDRRIRFFAAGHRISRVLTKAGGRAVILLPRHYRQATPFTARFAGDAFYKRASAAA